MSRFRTGAQLPVSLLHTPFDQPYDWKKANSYGRRWEKIYAPRLSLFTKVAERLRDSLRSLPRRIKQLSAPKAKAENYLPKVWKRNGELQYQCKGAKSWHAFD